MSCKAAHMLCMVKQPSTFLTLYRPTIVSATAAYSRVKSRRLKRNVIERVDRQRKKSTNPVLEVPKQMTIKQISQVTGRSRDNVIDVIHYVDSDFFKAKHFDRVGVTFPNLAGVLRKLGYRYKHCKEKQVTETPDEDAYPRVFDDTSNFTSRSPVVTIMGHVDHGKTTLLDKLRKTSVADGEAGGITQSIGAFEVEVGNGRTITFLDTPGHAAFSSMRQRGANLTDIVVLVVAADDGVMEQTMESINMARSAKVPIIVAINKCDVRNAKPADVLVELTEIGIQAEELGGDIQTVQISAKNGTGLNDLVDCISAQVDVLELRTDRSSNVEGVIIESHMHKYLGSVASAVIQHGTLKKGAYLVAGTSSAKVKQICDGNGNVVKQASASMPVDIIGWKSLPPSGEILLQVPNEARAKAVVNWRKKLIQDQKSDNDLIEITKHREEAKKVVTEAKEKYKYQIVKRKQASLDGTSKLIEKDPSIPELNIMLKADVDGSLGAVKDLLSTYNCHDECQLQVISEQVGDVSESDIELASTLNGIIVCYNVSPSKEIKALAEESDVSLLTFDVIYHLFNAVFDVILEKLPEVLQYEVVGKATVLNTFTTSANKTSLVAGCQVDEGDITSLGHSMVCRLIRGDTVVHEGKLASMFHKKVAITNAKLGMQCGILFNADGVLPETGDVIECCKTSLGKNELKWNPPGF